MEKEIINYVINTPENITVEKIENLVVYYNSPFKVLIMILIVLIVLIVLMRYFQLKYKENI